MSSPIIDRNHQKEVWKPGRKLLEELDATLRRHKAEVDKCLSPLVASYYPSLMDRDDNEYRKMVELSTKMTMVGNACAEIAGHDFDSRRQKISGLFGACCFLGDSFIDDFGDEVAREYLERFELLLTKGWFEVKSDREELFYIVLTRLFEERDVLDTMLRQAIFGQFLAQKRDVELRLNPQWLQVLPQRKKLRLLKECARNRGGHVTMVLSLFLVPELPLRYHHLLYTAGSLFMYIDDHGDCHSDRHYHRATYINQLRYPARSLRKIFNRNIAVLYEGLPEGKGRDFLLAFLYRYFITRLKKHRLEKDRVGITWTVYE